MMTMTRPSAFASRGREQGPRRVASHLGLRHLDSISLPGRPERLAPVPEDYLTGAASSLIKARRADGQLWSHQSKALELLQGEQDTVVATSTASGKSLVFQVEAIHRLGKHEDGTVLIFDPLRALAEDQLSSWREAAAICGMDQRAVVKIDGSVPMDERMERLEEASVAIMTPDICQAWLMRNSGAYSVQGFIGNLAVMILDEAHVYDSVFGSNASYLFRRLLALREKCSRPFAGKCRIIGATATISNAAEHMTNLTGREFAEVTEAENGAEIFPRTVYHLDGNGEEDMIHAIREMMRTNAPPKFIAFMDSRQGVERVARRIGSGRVLAYRNGYEAADRRKIETALRDGDLAGVISTSALELGINIPGLQMGMNLKLPSTRKGFRQRLGRVGRDGPGEFVIIGPNNLFTQFGETLEQYYRSSAEPSILYLNNKYIQFANAQCLVKETGAARRNRKDETTLDDSWPAGFADKVDLAQKGKVPPEYQQIQQMGRRNPHVAHAIRNISEQEIRLHDQRNNRRIGTSTLGQAIRETYPGAYYLHAGRSYIVDEWDPNGEYGSIEIRVSETPVAGDSEAIEEKDITISGVLDAHFTGHRDGKSYIAEVQTSITETVTGYRHGMRERRYDPNEDMIPSRFFDTTGVVIRIAEDWMDWTQQREQVGQMLEAITRYDCSIANWDVDHSASGLTICSKQHPEGQIATQAVLIYDDTHGSLRFTEALYRNFQRYIEQLERSVELEGEMLDREVINRLAKWADGLQWDQ